MVPVEIKVLLDQASFLDVTQIPFFLSDNKLIFALIERWRPRTHMFHMSVGECIITLQDVTILLGLLIDGEPVTGVECNDWAQLCQDCGELLQMVLI